MRLFKEDGMFQKIFGFLGKMIAWNLLWIICSLPVITIGGSTTALFYCTLKLHKDGDCSTFKDFFKSFKENFRQSTMVWMIVLLAVAGLYLERNAILVMPEMFQQIFSYLLLAICIPLFLVVLYVFPTLAAFDSKIKQLFTNAFYFAVKNLGFALSMAAITVLPMFFTLVDAKLFPVYLFLWLMCGFALTAYADSWFFWKLFKPYFQEQEEKKTVIHETDQYVY